MTTMYGIKNCDTIKKAQKWLEANGQSYEFHDYRVDGLNEEQLTAWVEQLGWEAMVNKRSTTWRNLDAGLKDSMDQASAIATMLEQPTLIKRPLLSSNNELILGFKAETYQKHFGL